MVVLYAVLCVLVLLMAPGLALLRWFRLKDGASCLSLVEAIVLVPCISVVVTSLVCIVLAELAVFRLHLLLFIVAVFSVVAWLARRSVRSGLHKETGRRVELAFLVAVVVVCSVLYFRPHEYVFGGWDPSVYFNTGASIERTGGILYRDEPFAALPRETQDALSHRRQGLDQRFPGMLIADHETGLITPQFHHLYPTWLAIFRSAGGDTAMLYANPLFGVLSVLMLFILCKRFLPHGAAFAATILFALNLTQIWQARFSTAEVLTQLCILTMLTLLMLYWESGSTAAAVLAMLAMSMALQARYDSLLLVPLLALVVYARNLWAWQRRDWVLVLGGIVAVAHIVLHSVFISFLYRPALQWITNNPVLSAAVAAGVVVVLAVFFIAFRRWPEKLSSFATGPRVRMIVIAIILVIAFYAYLVRPYHGDPAHAGDRQNFVALGWLLTPVGLALAVAGACLLVARARSFAELILIVVGLVVISVYTRRALIEDFYMWRVRRLVPVVIPMLCIFAGYAVAIVTARLGRWRPAACIVIALAIAAVPLVLGRAIVVARDNGGALDFVAEVAGDLESDAVYICNHYWLAMPLRLFGGFETYAVSDPEPKKCRIALDFAAKKLDEGRAVYYVDMDRPHIFPRLACVPVEGASYTFSSGRLEPSKGLAGESEAERSKPKVHRLIARTRRLLLGWGLPRGTEPVRFDAVVYQLVPIAEAPDDTADVDLTWEFEPDWFRAGDGFVRKGVKRIKVVKTQDGERHDPTPETPPSEIKKEYAWLTGRQSALWIPYHPARSYIAEIRLSGQGVEHGVAVLVGGREIAALEPADGFRTVAVEIPPELTAAFKRALLEFVSLAPDDYEGPRGVYIDRLRLRSVE